LPFVARLVLEIAAVLITLGGLFDLLTPRLPANLTAICGDNPAAQKLVRELLRALGGALVAIGVAVGLLVALPATNANPATPFIVLVLVLPAEGINAFCMRRVGSPFQFPLAIALLTLLGAVLAAMHT
jgi:hypothetical protein